MDRQLVIVVALCTLYTSVLGVVKQSKTIATSPLYIETGPSNNAVHLGSTVTLTCRIAPGTVDTAVVQWWEYGTNPNGAQISDMNVLLPGHPNRQRYSMIMDSPEQYDLMIRDIEPIDGTYFKCMDTNADPINQKQLGAQLVVIVSQPNCTTTMTSSIVLEDEYHTAECRMYFQASEGVYPHMFWTGPDPYVQASSQTNVSVWSGVSFTVTRSMDTQLYQCKTNFTEQGFDSPDSASNVPTWSYTYRTPQLLVHWGPKNMYHTPDQTRYDVNTVVTCHADAFPAASYFWQNVDSGEVWGSQSFRITETLVGTHRMRCHAENYINNILYYNDLFFDMTVNPVPTTQTPGASTTTTTPPDEAYCRDLTGRWQASNPKATMCIWVDYANNGVMSGMMRNGTETYWLDLYGRVQLNTFDQGGFSAVAPGEIGVTAYVLECKACFGVETMLVSQLQRSETSMETCGDPGQSLILPDFTFYRVDNAPPCSAEAPPA
jgi:hypothetical protein